MTHVVITGSIRGIGRGMAECFLKAGFKVTINGTSQNSVNKATEELGKEFPGKVQGFPCDVSNEKEVIGLIEQAVKGFGDIHIWINNAGIPGPLKNVWEIEGKVIAKIIDINIKGMIYGTNAAFRQMKKQGHGFIYNMEGFGSDGMKGNNLITYGTTKRALRYFTNSFTLEAKDSPVKIGTLSPGMVLTDFILDPIRKNPEKYISSRKIFNILADRVETVTPFLVNGMIKNKKNGAHIS